jgi:hypothetical protein
MAANPLINTSPLAQIQTPEDYELYALKYGQQKAMDNMLSSGKISTADIANAKTSSNIDVFLQSVLKGETPSVKAETPGIDGNKPSVQGNPAYQKIAIKPPLDDGGNALLNNNAPLSMKGVFGDNASTGWLSPALGAVNAGMQTWLAYDTLKSTKENNKAQLELANKKALAALIANKNKTNQANRYAMLGIGNSNSLTGTVGAVGATPYTSAPISAIA